MCSPAFVCSQLRSVPYARGHFGTRIGTKAERGLDLVALAGVRAVVGVALCGLDVLVAHPLLDGAHLDALRGGRGAVVVAQVVKR